MTTPTRKTEPQLSRGFRKIVTGGSHRSNAMTLIGRNDLAVSFNALSEIYKNGDPYGYRILLQQLQTAHSR